MLLEDASHDFTTARHGLVGRNGAGKTLLLRLLLGELPAQSGRIERRGRIAAVPQSCPPAGVTLADVAGMTPALRALARIEAGTGSQADFDLMDGRWRVRENGRACWRTPACRPGRRNGRQAPSAAAS